MKQRHGTFKTKTRRSISGLPEKAERSFLTTACGEQSETIF